MTNTGPIDPNSPIDPAAAPTGDPQEPAEQTESTPWYKRPITWIIAVVLLIAIVLGLVLAFSGGDSDSDYATVTIERVDDAGDALATEMLGSIRAPINPEAYRWVSPSAGAPGDAAATSSDSGTVTFRWGPTSEVAEPTEWASMLTMTESLPPNATLESDAFDCTLQRGDEPDALVALNVSIDAPADPEQPSIATYSFQNFEFFPADIMTCEVANGVPGATTTTSTTTTTTVPETTVPETTVPETTVPATTAPAPTPTTPPPATTVPATTVPATTVPETTVPGTTVMSVVEGRADLSTLVGLIDVAGLRQTLSDSNGTITLLAPDNDAWADLLASPDAPDVSDPTVVSDLLAAHTNLDEIVLAEQALADGQIAVVNGGPQPVDPGPPATVGGAEIVDPDLTADNGVVHVLGGVLAIQPT